MQIVISSGLKKKTKMVQYFYQYKMCIRYLDIICQKSEIRDFCRAAVENEIVDISFEYGKKPDVKLAFITFRSNLQRSAFGRVQNQVKTKYRTAKVTPAFERYQLAQQARNMIANTSVRQPLPESRIVQHDALSGHSDDFGSHQRRKRQRSHSFFSKESEPQLVSRSPTPPRRWTPLKNNGNGHCVPVEGAAWLATTNPQIRESAKKWALPTVIGHWTSNNHVAETKVQSNEQQLNSIPNRSSSSISSTYRNANPCCVFS